MVSLVEILWQEDVFIALPAREHCEARILRIAARCDFVESLLQDDRLRCHSQRKEQEGYQR